MKKILSLALATIMMLSMATTAFAAEIDTDGGSQETVVSYGMDDGFTVTIPTNFVIDTETNMATANVSASNVMIAHDKFLKVSISGNDYMDSWELIDESEAINMLTYTIGTTEGGSDIINNSVVLSVASGEAYNSIVTETMYFTVIDKLDESGVYKDTLTFVVEINDGPVIVDKSIFANNSWTEIIEAVQNNEVPSTWKVGDTKKMTINDIDYTILIIGKNHDTYADGGIAPLTFQLRGVYDEETPMNSTKDNTIGWAGSDMRVTTLPSILTQMPSEVQAAIRHVNKQTLKGDKSGLETTSDKLFLLSETEVFGTTIQSSGFAEGSRYAYYTDEIVPRKSIWTVIHYWWLRGPRYDNSISFSCVNLAGKLSGNNSGATSIVGRTSFAFCF